MRLGSRIQFRLTTLMVFVGCCAVMALLARLAWENTPMHRLIRDLHSGDKSSYENAAVKLAHMGSAAMPFLIGELKSSDPQRQQLAIRLLWRFRTQAAPALPALFDLLHNETVRTDLKAHIAYALPSVDEAGTIAVPELIQALKTDEVSLRHATADVLGKYGTNAHSAAEALEEALKDENPSVRVQAAKSLWLVGGSAEKAIEALVEELTTGYHWGASRALGEIGPEAIPAVPHLITALHNDDREVRAIVAEALGQIGPDAIAAVPALTEAFDDRERYVALKAAEAVWRITGNAQTVIPLLQQMRDTPDSPDSRVAHWSRRVLEDMAQFVPSMTVSRSAVGKPAREWHLAEWANSGPLDLATLRGNVVFIRFWTDACPFCARTMPAIQQLASEFRDQPVRFIGIYLSDRRASDRPWNSAVKTAGAWGVTFPIAYDRKWQTAFPWWGLDHPRSPTFASFVIDPAGKIAYVHPAPEFHPSDEPEHAQCDRDFQSIREAIRSALPHGG